MTHIPAMQVLWLVVYWAGLLPILTLLSLAFAGGATFTNFAALILAVIAQVIGSSWATQIARSHVGSTTFVKGTTAIRVISVAWLGVGAFILLGSVFSVLLSLEVGEEGNALGFIGTIGSVSILAIVGPAYVEYREARSKSPDAA